MQDEQVKEIHEVDTPKLPAEYEAKLARIRELTGMTDAEVRATALSRGVGSSFALQALVPRTLH